MERFENIWISSEDHLVDFREIKSKKEILRNAGEITSGERYYDFPRRFVGANVFPIIFKSIGRLIVSEEDIRFYKSSDYDDNAYRGINKDCNFSISFDQITSIELTRYGIAFFSYFDNNWIKIRYKEDEYKHLLISHSGYGFVMKSIKRKNAGLLDKIKNKSNIVD